ncbi:putative oxidoreductase [Portunus trituberculatus]|uniref:Putative oxidoreductase n=1 Tax=Portunus trituberculatus TaxID=210409 RepID=A0A5B7E9Q3_PORTR|nr:putative oxidoreductase [Portunus trituberculatus]
MWKMITVVLTYLASALRIVADAAILLLKRRLKLYRPVQCCCQNRVRGKVVIVTGASSGIGFAIAHDLASKGAHVYLAGRNIKTGQDAVLKLHKKTGNPAIHFLYLDLQDFCSIHAFVKSFLKCENQLNALVNNAAVFHHPSGLTTDQIEITYQTNYLGVYVGLADPGNVWTPIYRRSWRSWSLKHMLVRLQCYIFMRDAQEGAQSTIHFLNTPNPRSGQYINSFMVGEEKQPYDSSLVKRLVADSVFLTGLPRSSLPQAAVVTGVDGS